MGESLIKSIVQATGLPEGPVEKELHGIIEAYGANPEDITLDELRDVMVEYLQSVFMELHKDRSNAS